MKQQFTTTDVLRLEVEEDPTGLVNLVQNPSGELGGYGWVTPLASSSITSSAVPVALFYERTVAGASYFTTESMPLAAGQYVAASFYKEATAPNHYVKARFEFYSAAMVLLSSSAQTALAGAAGTYQVAITAAPASTAHVRLRFDVYTSGGADPGGSNVVYLSEVTVSKAATSGALGTVRTNLVPNPSFETNTTGWAVDRDCTIARSTAQAYAGAASLALTATTAFSMAAATPIGAGGFPVSPNATYTAQLRTRAATTARTARVGLFFYNAAGVLRGGSYAAVVPNNTTGWTLHTQTLTAPSDAAYARVIAQVYAQAAGEVHYVDAVMVEQAVSAGDYFDGSTVLAGHTFAWTGTAHASASTDATSNLAFIEPVTFLNVLGPTHDIKVAREALNTGTLEATVLDANLDPSQDDLIRPGRRVRLMALDTARDEWTPLFTGQMSAASVAYDLKNPRTPAQKRARVQLTAVDGMAVLANQTRSEGVATIDELPYVLEGCGTPWNVNGSGDQVPTADVVAINDNASAVDQVAITRDTSLGYAWLDRWGTLQVWDPTAISLDATPLLDDDVVTDYDVSYNTEDCINEVTIKFLRLNPDTGETEEIPYGPYRNETSIAEWGVRSAEFTVQGLSEETTEIPDLAATILASNSDPVVRINGVTAAVTTEAMLDRDSLLCDVMAYASISKATAPVMADSSFVKRIEHTITPQRWTVAFGFLHEDVVASPTFTPSPSTGAGGKTIGQLLRPVGEVTMWFGAKANIPAGWLALDGTVLASMPTDYPDLYALLGSTTLPDFTDKFPIGAGTKALGTNGGNPTKVIAEGNLPVHVHGAASITVATSSAAGTATARLSRGTTTAAGDLTPLGGNTGGGGFANTPLDVMNPWRALYFIIRAR